MIYEKYLDLFIGLPKSLFFNIKYFEIKDGIKLPVWISHRVILKKVEGIININSNIKFRMR